MAIKSANLYFLHNKSSIATLNNQTGRQRNHLRPAHQHRGALRRQRRPRSPLHMDKGQALLRPELPEQPSSHEEQRRHSDHHEPVACRPRLVPVQRHKPIRHRPHILHSPQNGRVVPVPVRRQAEGGARPPRRLCRLGLHAANWCAWSLHLLVRRGR